VPALEREGAVALTRAEWAYLRVVGSRVLRWRRASRPWGLSVAMDFQSMSLPALHAIHGRDARATFTDNSEMRPCRHYAGDACCDLVAIRQHPGLFHESTHNRLRSFFQSRCRCLPAWSSPRSRGSAIRHPRSTASKRACRDRVGKPTGHRRSNEFRRDSRHRRGNLGLDDASKPALVVLLIATMAASRTRSAPSPRSARGIAITIEVDGKVSCVEGAARWRW